MGEERRRGGEIGKELMFICNPKTLQGTTKGHFCLLKWCTAAIFTQPSLSQMSTVMVVWGFFFSDSTRTEHAVNKTAITAERKVLTEGEMIKEFKEQ